MKTQFKNPVKIELEEGDTQTKCLAHSECGGKKNWSVNQYKNAAISEQIKIAFCDKCINEIIDGSLISVSDRVKNYR